MTISSQPASVGTMGALNSPRVCCVIGAGDATGAAVARRFAREGYTVCVARRTAAALQPLVESIAAQGGQAESLLGADCDRRIRPH